MRPQRRRLRGAGRAAGGRRVPAGRRPRPTPTPSWSTPAGSSRRPRRTPSTRCWRRPTSRQGGRTQAVVAVGCLAERYGKELAESLPEADAVLGFDDYPDIAARLRSILAGEMQHPHTPHDRRKLLPITPADRDASTLSVPGMGLGDLGVGAPASGPRAVRRRLDGGPMAPLKLASGCDRRCSFCAIPSFRGSFVSRRPTDVARRGALAGRARACASCSWSARTPRRTARTSATCGCSRRCCPSWPPSTASSGSASPTSSRPRPGPGWSRRSPRRRASAPYFDLSFQHASATVLRRMRRFGDPESFLGLLDQVRDARPGGRRPLQRDRRASPARPRTTSESSATSSSPPAST